MLVVFQKFCKKKRIMVATGPCKETQQKKSRTMTQKSTATDGKKITLDVFHTTLLLPKPKPATPTLAANHHDQPSTGCFYNELLPG
jgi:hypothetical protein